MTAGPRENFDRWATSDNRPSVVPVRRMSHETVTFDVILRGLHDDHTPLSGLTAEALRLPRWITYAGAAFLLWWARDAEWGPQVRSYRAAAFLLADLDEAVRDRLLGRGVEDGVDRQEAAATG